MLSITGQVINVLQTPTGTRQDGTKYGGDYQVQLLCELPLQNGETKMDLVTLRLDDPKVFAACKGCKVMMPIGAFARNGEIHYFIPGGHVDDKKVTIVEG